MPEHTILCAPGYPVRLDEASGELIFPMNMGDDNPLDWQRVDVGDARWASLQDLRWASAVDHFLVFSKAITTLMRRLVCTKDEAATQAHSESGRFEARPSSHHWILRLPPRLSADAHINLRVGLDWYAEYARDPAPWTWRQVLKMGRGGAFYFRLGASLLGGPLLLGAATDGHLTQMAERTVLELAAAPPIRHREILGVVVEELGLGALVDCRGAPLLSEADLAKDWTLVQLLRKAHWAEPRRACCHRLLRILECH